LRLRIPSRRKVGGETPPPLDPEGITRRGRGAGPGLEIRVEERPLVGRRLEAPAPLSRESVSGVTHT